MSRTKEEPLEIEDSYRDILRSAVAKVGGQERAGKITGVHQTTIGRYINTNARPTYTTLMKMSRTLPNVPTPVVMIRDRDHAHWCELGALLAQNAPGEFLTLLQRATNQARLVGVSDDEWDGDPPPAPTPQEIANLKSVIANPLRTDRKKTVRRG